MLLKEGDSVSLSSHSKLKAAVAAKLPPAPETVPEEAKARWAELESRYLSEEVVEKAAAQRRRETEAVSPRSMCRRVLGVLVNDLEEMQEEERTYGHDPTPFDPFKKPAGAKAAH
mmetsp:Transcript_23840/g.52126  ORF Transcript_23840/g.52126 Transcript_23840/m.52126 type:complete len:115 (+) Transcript_23840:2-346(+)